MKKTIYTGVIAILLLFHVAGLYDISFTSIEGQAGQMSVYQGKKLLIVTLPCTQSPYADSLLYSLDTLASNNSQLLNVLAVPAKEDGFSSSNRTALLAWYRSKLGSQITIMEGANVRKTSGSSQHELFSWLTRVEKNESFDVDADAPGFMYFITGSGTLYGVLRPTSKIWGQSVQRTLHL